MSQRRYCEKGIRVLASNYTGWVLPDRERHRLLAMFPPLFPEVVAHHITERFPAPSPALLPSACEAEVVGYATDGTSVECLVVAINGETKRPDGKTYHITWSLDRAKGGRPVKSNLAIERFGVTGISPFVRIRVEPNIFSTTDGQ